MTEFNYTRYLPVKIVTKPVMKKTPGCKGSELLIVGWKVYINGAKYPEKPVEYYNKSEAEALESAIFSYTLKHGV
jgi:hypothetical protein